MRNTAPIGLGIIAVAALFGIVAAGVALVVFGQSVAGAIFVGGVVAVITALLLAIGWRAPASAPGKPAPTVKAAAATAAPVAAAAPVAKVAPAPAPAPKAAPAPAAAAEAKPVAADGKPEMLKAPRGGKGDDLKQIKGVGPKLEKMLNGMGVWHFDQVAGWRAKEVAWVDENLEGFKGRVSRDNWVSQAKVLAAGGTTEFSKKVEGGDVY